MEISLGENFVNIQVAIEYLEKQREYIDNAIYALKPLTGERRGRPRKDEL